MGLSKPYYRIVRPKSDVTAFVTDPRYATDRLQLSRAYTNIENELRRMCDKTKTNKSYIKQGFQVIKRKIYILKTV